MNKENVYNYMVYDYPEEPEDEYKLYTCTCQSTIELQVYARNEDEARDMCESQDYETCKIVSIDDTIECRIM